MQVRMLSLFVAAGLLTAACGGDSSGNDLLGQGGDDGGPAAAREDGGDVADGDGSAVVRIGDESWELSNVVCLVGVDSFDFLAADGIIGVSSGPTVTVKVIGDPLQTEAGVADVVFFAGPLMNPDLAWQSSTADGGAVVRTDGSRVTITGLFDNLLTDPVEQVEGTIEGDCGEMPEVPEVPETTLPDYPVDGTVVVAGETLDFTYDPAAGGRCNIEGNDGRITATGYLVDDPSRTVTFTYGLPEATPDGEAHLQLIIYGADGQQLWYSAVGFIPGSSTGSVDSMTQEGDTVRASGTLSRSAANPEELADFTIEATCTQSP